MTAFLLRVAIVAFGLWLATQMLSGIQFDSPGTLIAAALLLGVVNAVIRPIAVLLTLPLTLLTLGLFLLVINAMMLGLVAAMLAGFHISGFWTAAGASMIVSVVSWVASGLLNDKGAVEVMKSR